MFFFLVVQLKIQVFLHLLNAQLRSNVCLLNIPF